MKLISTIFLILSTWTISAQSNNEPFDKMMLKCQRFVDNYKPTYIIERDTLVVSRFTLPPTDVNEFLFECIKKNDFRPLKYSCVIVMKQNQEYSRVNHMDYILDDPSYAQNGFIELLRLRMGIPQNEIDYMAPMFTGDICRWIRDHKREIFDHQYIETYKNDK